jgi:hypothetical protein
VEATRTGVVADLLAACRIAEAVAEQAVRPLRRRPTVALASAQQDGDVDPGGWRLRLDGGGEQVRQPGCQPDADQHRAGRVETFQVGDIRRRG